MLRYLMLACAALSLLLLVAAATLVVHVEDHDLGGYRTIHTRTSYPPVEDPPGPFVRIVYLTLPGRAEPVFLYHGPFDNAAEISGRTPACFFP